MPHFYRSIENTCNGIIGPCISINRFNYLWETAENGDRSISYEIFIADSITRLNWARSVYARDHAKVLFNSPWELYQSWRSRDLSRNILNVPLYAVQTDDRPVTEILSKIIGLGKSFRTKLFIHSFYQSLDDAFNFAIGRCTAFFFFFFPRN